MQTETHALAARPLAVDKLSTAALRHGVLPMPNLAWTPEVERETAHLYEKVKAIIPPVEWPFHAPYVKAINDLKRERNAVAVGVGLCHCDWECDAVVLPVG